MYETTIEEILEAQNGNTKKLNDIVERNTKLIWSIVKRFQNRKYEIEDLFQIGAIGLIKSIKKFDTQYNVKLSTFAVPYILGEIKRFLRDDGIVKVSRNLKELNIKINMIKKEYEKQGKEITIKDLEKELKETKENILMAMELDNDVKSMDEEIYEENHENTLYNQIKVENHEEKTINKIVLRQSLESLSKKEKNIIILRYFYNKTQGEVAKKYGISQVQVSRIEKKVLLKMRENIKERF